MKTGKLVRNGEYRISETAEVSSIHNESGLAVDLLGADNGYRVFYHNEYRNVMMLHYTQITDWTDGGFVSQDNATGIALGSALIDKENMTVAFPKGDEDIEVSRLEKAGQWRLGLFIQGPISIHVANMHQTPFQQTWEVHSQMTLQVLPRSTSSRPPAFRCQPGTLPSKP